MDRVAQRNGDAAEDEETGENEEAPTTAPADGIADAVDAAEKRERRQRDVHAEEHSENVGKTAARIRPEPVRQRPSPRIRERLHGQPNGKNCCKILHAPGGLRPAEAASANGMK